MMQFLDPVHADYYTYSVDADSYKLPRIRLTASALVRMHTDPVENGNVDLAYFDKPAYGTLPATDPDADTLPEDNPATESTDVGSHGLQAYDEGEDETAAGANADTNESSEQSLIDKLAELKADCIRTSEEEEEHQDRESWWDKAKAFFTDTVKQAVTAGFEFSEGFWDGLKSQGEEILEMITDPVKLLQDLKTLYEAFKEDPEATAQAIFEQVIQDSAQDMKNLVECGAYDRGYIVGKYINPVKLAQLISHLRKASPILAGLKKDDPVDLNGDGRIDTIDMGFPIVRDKDGDGQFSQQEFKDAGITDQDGDGLVDIKDMQIVCQLRFHSQFGQVIPIYASFPAGTPIATEHGEKPIEQIGLNDKVLALDPDTLELSYQPVTDLFQRRADTIWTITANGKFVEQIDATTEHPFYVQGKGWVMARDLNPGDLIITADNTALVSRTVQSQHHDFVYNFTVANHNNYFVGKQQLWVHNVKAEKCGGGESTENAEHYNQQDSQPSNYTPNSPIDYDHALKADYSRRGSPTGGHTLLYGDVRIIPGTETAPDSTGVYRATIQVPDPNNPDLWITKTSNNSTNTMFPKDWDETRIKMEVDEAWNSESKVIDGNRWSATTPSGVKVSGYITPRVTVYPVFQE